MDAKRNSPGLGIELRAYLVDDRLMIHPEDDRVCQSFHRLGRECPCESGEPLLAYLPPGFYIENHPVLSETGFIVTWHGLYYEVLAFDVPG